MRINTNVSAIRAYTNLGRVQNAVSESMQKLSSGLRINKAADDAAGLGIANTLRAGTRALGQAAKNGEQASALLNVAEGGTSAIESILERLKELASQSASSNSGDRSNYSTCRVPNPARWTCSCESKPPVSATPMFTTARANPACILYR